MTKDEIKAGMVVMLTKPIANPEADRRATRDWTKAPEFEPGRYIVEDYWIGEGRGLLVITKESDQYRILHKIGPRHPAWASFIDACEPAPETLTSVLAIENGDNYGEEIVQRLLDEKVITLDDVRRIVRAIRAE